MHIYVAQLLWNVNSGLVWFIPMTDSALHTRISFYLHSLLWSCTCLLNLMTSYIPSSFTNNRLLTTFTTTSRHFTNTIYGLFLEASVKGGKSDLRGTWCILTREEVPKSIREGIMFWRLFCQKAQGGGLGGRYTNHSFTSVNQYSFKMRAPCVLKCKDLYFVPFVFI